MEDGGDFQYMSRPNVQFENKLAWYIKLCLTAHFTVSNLEHSEQNIILRDDETVGSDLNSLTCLIFLSAQLQLDSLQKLMKQVVLTCTAH